MSAVTFTANITQVTKIRELVISESLSLDFLVRNVFGGRRPAGDLCVSKIIDSN